jgi:hypothetical protein
MPPKKPDVRRGEMAFYIRHRFGFDIGNSH